MNKKYDAVVIGAGNGGLTAAGAQGGQLCGWLCNLVIGLL